MGVKSELCPQEYGTEGAFFFVSVPRCLEEAPRINKYLTAAFFAIVWLEIKVPEVKTSE